MAARLAAMRERNRALEEQILTLQDEERADIARDLHDEIGPHLFAANVDAAMAAHADRRRQARTEALEQVRRDRAPPSATSSGWCATSWGACGPRSWPSSASPAPSSTWWRSGARGGPTSRFETELPATTTSLPEALQETLYRLVQESLSNAVRHGAPSRRAHRDRGATARRCRRR